MGIVGSSPLDIPTMIFIDGGYLKNWITSECEIDVKDYRFDSLMSNLASNSFRIPNRRLQIIRSYFYDGLVDPKYGKYSDQKKFQEYLEESFDNFEVKTSYLKEDRNRRFQQKGVDTLLAIDMLDKALSNQYEIAILIAGDLDHYEVVKAVKDKGKQVFGVYYDESKSKDLVRIFDRTYILNKGIEGTFKLDHES